MTDARCQRLTQRVTKALFLGRTSRVDPIRKRRLKAIAELVAELLSRRGPAWPLEEIGVSAATARKLKVMGLAERWVDSGGGSWLVLTQRSADLGRRVPSSDGGLRDPEVSRAVALGRDGKPEKPEPVIPYAQELARKGDGLFARARWAS